MVSVSSVAEIEECRRIAASWAPILHALAHEERLLIALWLAEGECTVRELEAVTGMGQSLVPFHLQELRRQCLYRVGSGSEQSLPPCAR